MAEYLEKCSVCEKPFKNRLQRVKHLLEEHNLTFEQYILKTLYNDVRPTCKCGCGKETAFTRTITKGWFFEYYTNHFPRKKHSEETKKKIAETYKRVTQEKYGVDNMFQLEHIKEKIKQTNVEKYGVENPMVLEDIKVKVKSTKKEKYGNENYRNEEKIKQTNRNKYGSDYYMSTEEFKDKSLKTIQEVYGVDNVMKNNVIVEKLKQSNVEKYGVDHPMKTKEVSEKCLINLQTSNLKNHGVKSVLSLNWVHDISKLTSIDRYGVEYPSQNIDIQKKAVETNRLKYNVDYPMSTKEFKDNVKQTNIKKYGVPFVFQVPKIREKIENIFLTKFGAKSIFEIEGFKQAFNPKHSKAELEVCEKLNGESGFIYNGKEYDIKLGNNLFEIDGDYFHTEFLQNLNLPKLNSCINDFKKIKDIQNSPYKLYKIFISNLPKEITEENLIKNSYVPNFELNYEDVIVSKEYLKTIIEREGKEYLEKYLKYFLTFIKTFQPTFPYHKPKDDIEKIKEIIFNYKKFDTIFNKQTKVFNNSAYTVGTTYLKAMFHSYWKSSFRGNKSPVQIWESEKDMTNIIKYRIGLNNSGEIYDFSLKNLVKGISAVRGSISFFKPIVAACIYREFLKDFSQYDAPKVFDPCCGFGGRMLGFKSSFPNGIYVGCEPNVETYNELLKLSKNFTNVTIYNCKVEELVLDNYDFDLSFTSIPYFDLEEYSNVVEYNSLEHWKETFIKSLYKFPNLLLNIPKDLENCFENVLDKYYLKNSVSKHLTKKNEEEKYELILKFF